MSYSAYFKKYPKWTDLEYPVQRPMEETCGESAFELRIDPGVEKQTILGLGFEIQSDSIASGNSGLPAERTSVPHDLTLGERNRFADEMLKGFRYCRLAGGLFWRGCAEDGKTLRPRWPEQLEELRHLLDRSGVEGVQLEYWSCPPAWKTNRKLHGFPFDGPKDPDNQLRCWGREWAQDPEYKGDTERFLKDFAAAQVQDVRTLLQAKIPVCMWGMTNEPQANTAYASCVYTPQQWAETWRVVGPAIRESFPGILLVGDSGTDTATHVQELAKRYPKIAELIDYLTIHTIGYRADSVTPVLRRLRDQLSLHRPVFQNEYEYLKGPTSPDRCLNTVNNILNWFQVAGAPSWFWIHALKPVMNSESSGYSLGFWMPADGVPEAIRTQLPPHLAALRPGEWTWNPHNWHAVAGFLKHIPWNSKVVQATCSQENEAARYLAAKTPEGRLVIAVSNHTGSVQHFTVETGSRDRLFQGYRYSPESAGPDHRGVPVAPASGSALRTSLPDRCWEFWVESNS